MDNCPSQDQLADLLSGRLDPSEQDALETHLGECSPCQQAVLHLGEAPAFLDWRKMHSRIPAGVTTIAEEPSETFLRQLKERVLLQESRDTHVERGSWPVFPGYDVLDEIGHGGLAVVYKALQRSLNRLVAIKFLRADLSIDDLRRARRARDTIANLHHPHVVEFYDVLVVDGRFAIVLEYLEGGSLHRRIRNASWTTRQIAEMFLTLAETVRVIHDRGILHRDLKPSNILLTAAGLPKIADFGLARPFDGGEVITRSGDIVGTAGYIAPEQVAGRKAIAYTVDIYGLGTILYEMLTGRPPFQGASRIDTLTQVVHEDPVPPRRLNSSIPRDLEAICLRCLTKDPSRRYQSAAALVEDVRRFLDYQPLYGCRISSWERLGRWVRRRPATAAVFFTGMLLFLLVQFGMWAISAVQLAHVTAEGRQTEVVFAEVEIELYHSRLAQARQELQSNDRAAAEAILSQCLPRLGRPDRRGPEWHELWQKCHRP